MRHPLPPSSNHLHHASYHSYRNNLFVIIVSSHHSTSGFAARKSLRIWIWSLGSHPLCSRSRGEWCIPSASWNWSFGQAKPSCHVQTFSRLIFFSVLTPLFRDIVVILFIHSLCYGLFPFLFSHVVFVVVLLCIIRTSASFVSYLGPLTHVSSYRLSHCYILLLYSREMSRYTARTTLLKLKIIKKIGRSKQIRSF